MKTHWMAVVPVLLLCGCAGEPTPYQRAEAKWHAGYSEKRISEDTFYVTYTASSRTPGPVVGGYLCQRAAEVTLRYGFRYFAVLRGPRQPTGLQVRHVTRQEATEKWDPIVVEEPVSGTVFITIQCFQDMPEGAEMRPVEAKSYLEKNSNPQD